MANGCGIQFYCENGIINDGLAENSEFDSEPNFTSIEEIEIGASLYGEIIFEFFLLNCLIFGSYGCFIANPKKMILPGFLLVELCTIWVFFFLHPLSTFLKFLGLISSCFLCWNWSVWTDLPGLSFILPADEFDTSRALTLDTPLTPIHNREEFHIEDQEVDLTDQRFARLLPGT